MSKRPCTMDEINSMEEGEFVRVVGSAFEHSPWIAQKVAAHRPFSTLDSLHEKLCEIVLHSNEAQKIALIQAHPDLVGQAALQGTLTAESTVEQRSAGLGNLSAEEIELFQKLNATYRAQFDFPFVICARMNKKEAVLRGFQARLKNSRASEIDTALQEIFKIARLRLEDLIS